MTSWKIAVVSGTEIDPVDGVAAKERLFAVTPTDEVWLTRTSTDGNSTHTWELETMHERAKNSIRWYSIMQQIVNRIATEELVMLLAQLDGNAAYEVSAELARRRQDAG